MKNSIKYILQQLLGYQNYLMLFAHFKIVNVSKDKKESDFFHFIKLLNNPQVVLDIGANIGIMTTHLSNRFPDAKIHAFEPMPDNLSVLKRIIKRYKLNNVRLHEIALGAVNGKVKMVLPKQGKTKMQGLSHVVHESINEWNEGIQVEVNSMALDFLFPEINVQGIKLDVENFEYFVLMGGKSLIERSRPIIYTELWDNENRQRCFAFLKEINYQAHVVVGDCLKTYDSEKHRHQNFIFLP